MPIFRRWLALCLLALLPVLPVGAAQAASVLFIATSNVPPGKFRLLADMARPHGIDVQVRYLGKIPADADAGLFQGQDMVFFDTYQQDEVRQHLARALPGLRVPHAWLYDARPAWGGGVMRRWANACRCTTATAGGRTCRLLWPPWPPP